MGFVVTDHGTQTIAGANTLSFAPTSNIAAGSLILAYVVFNDNSGLDTCGDSQGNTYTRQGAGFSSAPLCHLATFRCSNCTAISTSDTVTWNSFGGVTGAGVMGLLSVTGVAQVADAKDQHNEANGTSTTPSATTPSQTQSGDLVIGTLGWVAAGGTPSFTQDSTNGSYSSPPALNNGNPLSVAGGHFTLSGSGAVTYAPTISSSAAWGIIAMTFKAASTQAPFVNMDVSVQRPIETNPYRTWVWDFGPFFRRAPFRQLDWPTPPPVIWSRSWEWRQVGYLGKDTLPNNQKDWPNPYPVVWYQHFEDGPLPNLYGRDFLPKNQKDWPNPYPVIWYRDWEDGPLPNLYGKDTLPKRQMDWPTPPPVVWYQEWHSDLLQTTLKPGAAQIPFLQFDWPNPQPVTWYRDWEDGPLPNLLGQDRLPNRQQDWPNPYPVQWYKTWESWYNLNLRGRDNLPFNQKDWPNPPPVQWFKDWSQSLLLQASQKAPFAQRDWPVPQGVLWYRDNGPPTTTPLRFAGAKPFKQTDWPFPQPVFWYRDSNFSTFNPRYPVIVVGTDLHFKPTQAMVGRLGNLGGIP